VDSPTTALEFARALVARDFEKAFSLQAPSQKEKCGSECLKSAYCEMIFEGLGPVLTTYIGTTMTDWPEKLSTDELWAYVVIEGADYSEAITVVVENKGNVRSIREVEWGRP
jgi:hypothetical protein